MNYTLCHINDALNAVAFGGNLMNVAFIKCRKTQKLPHVLQTEVDKHRLFCLRLVSCLQKTRCRIGDSVHVLYNQGSLVSLKKKFKENNILHSFS